MTTTNRLLGYPDDARLLILNADDFGMYPAINHAVLSALREGVATSTSLMVPCPAAQEAMDILRANPDIGFAVHLTVICDIPTYRFGPMVAKHLVPSLLDETGTYHTLSRMAEAVAQFNLSELEREFRAQIEAVLNAGLHPTHLDWHCLHNGGRPDIFDLSAGLAKEYGLALRVSDSQLTANLQSQGLPAAEFDLLDSFAFDIDTKAARYTEILRNLPAGLSEWAVHPGLDNDQARTIDAGGWPVRASDHAFLVSPQAKQIIQQEGIILLNYHSLQAVWRKAAPA